MTNPASFKALSLALLSTCFSGAALAHGDAAHDKPPHATPAEQQVFGIAGRAAEVSRSIDITMSDDMRFKPDRIDVREGETVRLRLHNKGQVLHELVIGTPADLDQHAALMAKFPDMAHEEAHMAHVPAGKSGSIIWKFNRAGSFDFACLINGHYQAGMRGRITVQAKAASGSN
ncbi:cupredoxin family protein [Paucibacter sp. AS339]|uniref:cupredoxin domain-containing protein n=1 Tax=Paucibacter hankyongi TaxID=3133434 RepID=UPI00309822F2